MKKNYFIIAWRNMQKQKGFSFLNIAGLALGFTACFLIALFVWDEYQFDKFLPEGDQVYRVYDRHSNHEGTQYMAITSPMISPTLNHNFPEVEQTTRIIMLPDTKRLFEVGSKKIYQEKAIFVDSTFFEIFPLEFKSGSPVGALDQPSSIILSRNMAEQFFGNEDPVGKQIIMDKLPLTVKGVIDNQPNFHLQFNAIMPLPLLNLPSQRMESWGWQQFYNYIKLKEGADAQALEGKFQPIVDQKMKEDSEGSEPSTHQIFFQPLEEIYLQSSNFVFDNSVRGNIIYVKALTFIALFILLIGCFNFINLATAKSFRRAKEVGIRKTIGADRKQLITQFIGETVFLTLISIILSVALTALFLPWLNEFTGKNIDYSVFTNPLALLIFLSLTLLVGILAGIYPALVLSNFRPVKVLKGSALGDHEPGKTPFLRHGLVVLQFSMSALLIISAIIVFKQVNYLHNKDLGFDKEQIMFFQMRGQNMNSNKEIFKDQLEKIPGVSAVSMGYGFPGDVVAGDGIKVMKNGQLIEHPATQLMIDYDYIKTLGLEVVAGRAFSEEMGSDKEAFIINETAVKNLGFENPENAIGKQLTWNVWSNVNPDSLKVGPVIGVVRDFNYKSLYEKIETTVLQIFPDAAWKVAIKMETSQLKNSLVQVEDVWNTFSPEHPLEYKFLDDNFEKMYESEDKLKTLLGIFTVLAIFVGCLGLFGLAAFSAERRKREIGIRKVLGASVENIVLLMSKDFVQLVIIALIIASPIAWYFMNGWLQDFAYRINISWMVFAIAGFTSIGIALITVVFHAVKAARGNPVKYIRLE